MQRPSAGADRRRIDDVILQLRGLRQRRREAEKRGADAAAEVENAQRSGARRQRGDGRKHVDRDDRPPGARPRVLQPPGEDLDPFGPVEAGSLARYAGEVGVYALPNIHDVGHRQTNSAKNG